MTYFCFVESSILSVPHMEPLEADDLEAAKAEAGILLAVHASGYAAHIFEDEERVATIRPEGRYSGYFISSGFGEVALLETSQTRST